MKILCVLALLASGCSTVPVPEHIPEPSIYSVRPPMAAKVLVSRPVLKIHQLSREELGVPATLVKAYGASLIQLIGYAESLEKVLDQLQREYTVFDADPFFNL